MTINRNQIHVTFLYIEFLLGYLNIDCEFEVQKKRMMNITQGLQYFSCLPVLHYLQAVLFIEI